MLESLRVGTGVDVHPFIEGRPLILGGLEIPHDKGLEGHSDADVLSHAIADALLGAMNEGDLGRHFPSSDEKWRGVSSLKFLEHIRDLLAEKGGRVLSIDSVIIAQEPRLSPHAESMRDSVARALGVENSILSVKATTTDKLGFTGRSEGIAAQAVCLLALDRAK